MRGVKCTPVLWMQVNLRERKGFRKSRSVGALCRYRGAGAVARPVELALVGLTHRRRSYADPHRAVGVHLVLAALSVPQGQAPGNRGWLEIGRVFRGHSEGLDP